MTNAAATNSGVRGAIVLSSSFGFTLHAQNFRLRAHDRAWFDSAECAYYLRRIMAAPPPPPSNDDLSPPVGGEEVTRLLAELRDGDEDARERVARAVYREIHLLAEHALRREPDGHTLRPTELVHETFIRLVGQRNVEWRNRSHFYGIASQAIRRILVDHARRRRAVKRDQGVRVTLDESVAMTNPDPIDLLVLEQGLEKLAAADPRQASVVEMRFFGGLEIEEIAEALGVSPATVKRDWTFARAFLRRELDQASQE